MLPSFIVHDNLAVDDEESRAENVLAFSGLMLQEKQHCNLPGTQRSPGKSVLTFIMVVHLLNSSFLFLLLFQAHSNMSNKETAFANHVLASIKKDLDFLKQQQYLTPAAYDEIKRNLPNTITAAPAAAAASPASRAVPSPPSYNNAAPNTLATAEALYDFNGPNPQDLSFRQGEIIQVTEYGMLQSADEGSKNE